MKWKDKKDVHMIGLSTFYDASTKEAGCQHVRKVKAVFCCNYNNTMGGVNLSDCFLLLYPSEK